LKFNWESFLKGHGVHYVTQGSNVAKGHVNIRCPFCGSGDPSQHMGIRLSDGAWACYRNPEHRSRNVPKLVRALLRCSYDEAKQIVNGLQLEGSDVASLADKLHALDARVVTAEPKEVQWPPEFKPFSEEPNRFEKRFHHYVESRGFPKPYEVAHTYDLRWALGGRFGERVLFPLDDGFKMVGWTGRHIGKSKLRYNTEGDGASLLFNLRQCLQGGRVLIVVEGPFDALKLDYYGSPYGLRAVAMLGLTFAARKLRRVAAAMKRFDATYVLLDREAESVQLGLLSHLGPFGCKPLALPPGVKDPGELTRAGVLDYVSRLARIVPRDYTAHAVRKTRASRLRDG
jgi:hypothetical protein